MKKYLSGMIAVVIASMCFGFTNAKQKQKPDSYVILKFMGDIHDKSQVEDETLWVEDPTFDEEYEGCYGSGATCAIRVDENSVLGYLGSRYLDSSKIWLVASPVDGVSSAQGYWVEEAVINQYFISYEWNFTH